MKLSRLWIAVGLILGAVTPSIVRGASLPAAFTASRRMPTIDYQFGVVNAPRDLSAAQHLGVGWTRVPLFWDGIQPQPGSWNVHYTGQDRALLTLAAAGIVPVGVVQTVPQWASVHPAQAPDGVPRGLYLPWNDPRNLWGQFMYQLARHYAGLINTWIIGNEISIASGPYHTWDGTVAQMAQMIRVAYQAVRAANPAAQIQAPGAPYWYTYGNTTNALLTALAQLPGASAHHDYIDGINLHLYNTLQFNAAIFAQYRAILARHGLARLPIWLSEANASPAVPGHPGVSLSQQENFLVEDLASSLGSVSRVEVYQMRDPKSLIGAEGPTGLVAGGGTPRPAYYAVQTLVHVVAGTRFMRSRLHRYRGYSPSSPAVVTFGGPGRLVQIVWDQGFRPTAARLKAWAPTATVISVQGATRLIHPTSGIYHLVLPGSTDHNPNHPHDAPIGGTPFFVVQRVGPGVAGTPTQPVPNSPAMFAAPTPATTVRRGSERASFNPSQATVTISSTRGTVTVGGWGTRPGDLLGPSGIAIGPDGTVYVTNSGTQSVVAYRPSGSIAAVWGSWGDGAGQFNGPTGIQTGPHGTVYVADTLNQRVEAFTPHGTFLGQVASPWPMALRVQGSGQLLATDAMTGQSHPVDFPKSERALPAPAHVTAMAVNSKGAYAVATTAGQVLIYRPKTGKPPATWTIPAAYGNRARPAITALLWTKNNTLYILDGRYNRILALSPQRAPVPIRVTVHGLIDGGTAVQLPLPPTLLLGPKALTQGPGGTLWIANTDRQRLDQIAPNSGRVLQSVALHDGPAGLLALPNGDLVVSGYYGDTVTAFSPIRRSIVWRTGSPGSGANQFRHPTTLVALPQGRVAVWDTGNHRAVVLSPAGKAIDWIQAPAGATALSALPSGVLAWATAHGLIPTPVR